MKKSHFSRRDFNRLSAAAFGGMMAGTMIGCQPAADDGDSGPANGGPADGGPADGGPADDGSGGRSDDAGDAGGGDDESASADVHVCRGLNACSGESNGCAGTSQCATAAAHTCGGQNACKGQGGCGENPGGNDCKEQGHCAVPLKADMWTKARAAFEEKMKAEGKVVGPAPDPA